MKSKTFINKFFIVLCIGVLVNIAQLIYQTGNGDTSIYAVAQAGFGWECQLGRWMIQYVSNLRNNVVLPIYIQMISLAFLSGSLLMICDIFELRNQTELVISALLFLAQPFVCAVMTIYYCADAYCISVFLSVLGAWLIIMKKTKLRWGGAIVCLVISLSLYQSNIVMAGILLLFWCIRKTLSCKESFILCLKQMFYCLITGISAIAFYIILLKLYLRFKGLVLADYKGMSNMGHLNLKKSFAHMWEFIAKMYFDKVSSMVGYQEWPIGANIPILLNCICIILLVVLLCLHLVKEGKNFDKRKVILCIFEICMIPFMWTIIVFMAPEASVSALLIPHLPLIYFIVMWALKRVIGTKHGKEWQYGINAILIGGCIIASQYIFYINEIYYAHKLVDNKVYALAADINSRLYNRDDWSVGMKIAIVGEFDTLKGEPSYLDISGRATLRFWSGYGGQAGWISYINEQMGVYYNPCSVEEYNAILESVDLEHMELYPAKNSIRNIDDVIVIKLSD